MAYGGGVAVRCSCSVHGTIVSIEKEKEKYRNLETRPTRLEPCCCRSCCRCRSTVVVEPVVVATVVDVDVDVVDVISNNTTWKGNFHHVM